MGIQCHISHIYKQNIYSCLHSLLDSGRVVFKVVNYHAKIDNGWRLATMSEVEKSMGLVKRVLRYRNKWIVCKLKDGSIKGRGYGYIISKAYKGGWGEKLIIKSSKLPQLIKYLFHSSLMLHSLILNIYQ